MKWTLLIGVLLWLYQGAVVPTYHAALSERPVIIDGLSSGAWDEAQWSIPLVDLGGTDRDLQLTRYKVLYDDTSIYVLIEALDTTVSANVNNDQISLHDKDDAVELFIDPDGDGQDYIEIQINAIGASYQLRMDRPYSEGGALTLLENADVSIATNILGTHYDDSDTDQGYTVEMQVSKKWLQSFCTDSGDCFSDLAINIARVEQVDGGQKYQSWAPIGEVNLHVPERWGRLVLGD